MRSKSGKDPWRHARIEMVRQLRRYGIAEEHVLHAMKSVPRHAFVPHDLIDLAYADRALPIGFEQTISQPFIVARMAELLNLTSEKTLLDVGTGSGYAAAVFARLAKCVLSIERLPQLAQRAEMTIQALGYENITIISGDGGNGYPARSPYDAIAVAAAAREIPPTLLAQLADGGRLVMPIGDGLLQHMTLVFRDGTQLLSHDMGEVLFVPLVSDAVKP